MERRFKKNKAKASKSPQHWQQMTVHSPKAPSFQIGSGWNVAGMFVK